MSSWEEFSESVYEHLHKRLALQELNMSCPTNKWVQISIFYPKINVDPVQHIWSNSLNNIISHLHVISSILLSKKIFFVWNLYSSTIKRCILILIRGNKYDIFEPFKTSFLREFVQKAGLYSTRLVLISHP
jgi:hypothetical protein